MTPFTDNDLKWLKEQYLDEPIHSAEEVDKFMKEKGKALLARLEAAERMAEHIKSNECCGCDKGITLYKAWREAAEILGIEKGSAQKYKGGPKV